MARAKAGHTWSPPHSHGQGAFGWPLPTAPCPDLPRSFSPSVSHHLQVSLRAWRVARSWHRLSTEICWPVCWAWPRGPGLSPDSMMMWGGGGAGFSCTESGPPRPTDGQPWEEATWQGCVVNCSSSGFISKILLRWREHTCPQQGQPPEAPTALGRLWWEGWSHGLALGAWYPLPDLPSVLGGGLKKTWRACAYTKPEAKEVRHPAPPGPRHRQGQVSPPATCGPQGWTLKTAYPRGQQTL